MNLFSRPSTDEYAPYYGTYIDKVDSADILDFLTQQGREVLELLHRLSEEQSDYRYQPGKWSVKEVIGHMIDTERVFGFRALWFARGDGQAQPGMDENAWAAASNAAERPLVDICREQEAVRTDHLFLFQGLDAQAADRSGIADEKLLTVQAIPWIIAGHERHHLDVLYNLYGLKR